MKLFLHVGTEKTGSSHIQTLCVASRNNLASAGIWFPEGIPRHERRMHAGLVSAGNAFLVASKIRDDEHEAALSELLKYRERAQAAGCHSVFLTSELLLPFFAGEGYWEKLFEIRNRAGFSGVSVLVVLRDPVDQLVSLFKHRARGGNCGRLAEWVASGYMLPEQLRQLRAQSADSECELIARRYTRTPGGLEKIFFADWLEIEPLHPCHEGEINPSLSLSELELLRVLHDRRPELVPFMHDRLSSFPREGKVQGKELLEYSLTVAKKTIWENRDEWRCWNEILPEDEQLVIPDNPRLIPEFPPELAFSRPQCDLLIDFLVEAVSSKFLVRLFWQVRIRPRLGRIARAMGVRRSRL